MFGVVAAKTIKEFNSALRELEEKGNSAATPIGRIG